MAIFIPLTKTVLYTVDNGTLKIEERNGSYYVTYINPLYKNSPFELPTQFSTDFTPAQVAKSSEVISFVHGITK